jgi:hypothetical protein
MTDEVRMNHASTASAPQPERPGIPGSRTRQITALLTRGPAGIRSPAARWAINALALAGAALIIVSAIIHLRLWAQGYSGISVIGPLFLAQGVVSIPLAVAAAGLLLAGAVLIAAARPSPAHRGTRRQRSG